MLHHAIRNEFADTVAEYFKTYPDRIDDPRTKEGIKVLLRLMERLLTLVDQYEISGGPPDA